MLCAIICSNDPQGFFFMNQKIQTTQIFSGDRYDRCQLDEDALSN